MILITNRVKPCDSLSDNRLSQAGLNYQEKLSEFIKPEYEISFIPIFLNFKYKNEKNSKHVFINTINKTSRLFRLFRCISDSVSAYRHVLRQRSEDVLVYNLDIHNIVFVSLLIFFSKKRVYLVVADYIVQKSVFFKYVFDFVYSRLNGVIVLNDNIKVNKNSKLLAGLVRRSDIVQSSSNDVKSAILSGSLGHTTGFDLCLETFSRLPQINLNITGKPYHYTIEEFHERLNTYSHFKNITYHGLLDKHSYNEILSDSSIALSLRNPAVPDHDFNFPSKILEYLASGKFVISSRRYGFIPDNIIFYCEFTPESIENTIKKILDLDKVQVIEYKTSIMKFVEENFTENCLMKCIEELTLENSQVT